MSRIIGIDLGTTNSCVATIDEHGQPQVLASEHGERTIPSTVAWTDGGVIVGHAAKRQAVTNAANTLYGSKRLIGRKINSPEVAWFAQTATFDIAPAPNGDTWIRIADKLVPPQAVSAYVLGKMREIAEAALGEPITRAVVTVPAYFNEAQRQATKDAGKIAGLDIARIVNEPTAAALAYGAHRVGGGKRTIAIFDLGGGTFDVSIMAVDQDVFEVLATNGDMTLGGDDWDRRLMYRIAEELFTEHKVDVLQDPMSRARLREAAELAKRDLGAQGSSLIRLQYLGQTATGAPIHVDREVGEVEFSDLTTDLSDRLRAPCEQALKDAGITTGDIDDVILVGGMTRLPSVQRKVAEIFECKPSRAANPDEIVAIGAALHGEILAGRGDSAALLDVIPHSIGVRIGTSRFAAIVPRNAMLPVRKTKLFATSRDDQEFFRIELFQGESQDVSNNKKLGEITLSDLPSGKAGSVRIELTITVDVESIIHVSARERKTGRETTVSIRPSGGLSNNDIEDLVEERRGKEPENG